MIKAILFDLDGVLVDAVKLHEKAFLEAVKPYREIDEEYHINHLNGLPTKKKLEKLIMNRQTRQEIGAKAKIKALQNYTTKNGQSEEYYEYLRSKIG